MVQQTPNPVPKSPGLLPTPIRQSSQDNADPFVGRSYYPLPYPLLIILEGSQLSKLISWDISVSSKQAKLKLEWSTSSDASDYSSNVAIFPEHILQALKLFNLAQPSWSISTAKSKLTTKVEWQISHSKSNLPHPVSPNLNTSASSFEPHDFKTPLSQNFKNTPDSGFQSLNSNRRLHGDLVNWRRSVNLPPNPSFVSPRWKNRCHDIFVASNPVKDKASTKVSKNSSSDLPNSDKPPSPVLAREVKYINVKPDTSQAQGKTPNQHDQNCCSKDSSTSVSNTISSSHSPAKDDSFSNKDNPIADVSLSPNPWTDFPDPPNDFPKHFLDAPNPLPIVGDGFLNPKTAAYFMNISGSCRLCGKTVSSYLIDHHLILCSGLDRQPLESFAKFATKEFSLKKNKVVEASLLYTKFEMNDASVPNKYFKKVDRYRSFVLKLEDLSKKLSEAAFKKLKLSPKLETFNILKYHT